MFRGLRNHAGRAGHLVRFAVLGMAAGAVSGAAAFALLRSLAWATDTRVAHGWLIWLLPPAGFVIGLVHHVFAGRAAGGSNVLLPGIPEPGLGGPPRMA